MKIFSQTLTRTDVRNRLSVKSQALSHLPRFRGPQRAQTLKVEDEEGTSWQFRYRISHGKYKKPELSTGWLSFIRSKNLSPGDKIQFLKEEEEATGAMTYKIKVKIAVRLFGAVIGYVPYQRADR